MLETFQLPSLLTIGVALLLHLYFILVPRPDEFNASQFIEGMECQLSVDTTFDLSHLYVTLIIGKLAKYK